MITTSNYTLYGMHNNAERYSWAAYHLYIFLSSLIGDSIILYSSFQKDAFKVHQVIIAVIQHIAVSDIAVVILRVFPRMISLTANSRMIGDVLCISIHLLRSLPTGEMPPSSAFVSQVVGAEISSSSSELDEEDRSFGMHHHLGFISKLPSDLLHHRQE